MTKKLTAKVLNSHCVCCNRVLVDAYSMEKRVGPICRARLGLEEEPDLVGAALTRAVQGIHALEDSALRTKIIKELHRKGPTAAANKLIHYALNEKGVKSLRATVVINDLGYERVAAKIAEL